MVVHLLHTEQGVGSSLTATTKQFRASVTVAPQTPNLLDGVQFPGPEPN